MPSINSKKLLKFLKSRGFYVHHQVSSHITLKHSEKANLRVTLPMHNKDIQQGTLASILKQAGIDKSELFS